LTISSLQPALTDLWPEFQLVVACCRWPSSSITEERVRALSIEPIDWTRVLRIAHRHRVVGLVHRSIVSYGVDVPPDISLAFSTQAKKERSRATMAAMEAVRLNNAFKAAGIRAISLKGASIAMLAYGNLGLRQAKDIDFLIPQVSFAAMSDVMEIAGYLRTEPATSISEEGFRRWLGEAKGTEWKHRVTGMLVEIDWKLSLGPSSRSSQLLLGKSQQVRILPDAELTTLSEDNLVLYLCLHGSSHSWFRLKWLADVGALLQARTPGEIAEIYRLAGTLRLTPAVGQALLLCAEFFGIQLGDALYHDLRNHWVLRRLRASALRYMLVGKGEVELTELPPKTTVQTASHFLLARGAWTLSARATHLLKPFELLISTGLPAKAASLIPDIAIPDWLVNQLHRRENRG
jgi:Uncharacterised nucleotidyltransferase